MAKRNIGILESRILEYKNGQPNKPSNPQTCRKRLFEEAQKPSSIGFLDGS